MNEELYHHGILGQKWGIRRFQNPDGTLTPLGLKRLQKSNYKEISNLIAGKKNKMSENEMYKMHRDEFADIEKKYFKVFNDYQDAKAEWDRIQGEDNDTLAVASNKGITQKMMDNTKLSSWYDKEEGANRDYWRDQAFNAFVSSAQSYNLGDLYVKTFYGSTYNSLANVMSDETEMMNRATKEFLGNYADKVIDATGEKAASEYASLLRIMTIGGK